MKSYCFLIPGIHEDVTSFVADWLGQFCPGAQMIRSASHRSGLSGAIDVIDLLSAVCLDGSRN